MNTQHWRRDLSIICFLLAIHFGAKGIQTLYNVAQVCDRAMGTLAQ